MKWSDEQMCFYDNMFLKSPKGQIKTYTDWAVEWFSMSNDAFHDLYGFNFNPHHYEGLYQYSRQKYFKE